MKVEFLKMAGDMFEEMAQRDDMSAEEVLVDTFAETEQRDKIEKWCRVRLLKRGLGMTFNRYKFRFMFWEIRWHWNII
jgi:hypothetical protein